MSEKTSFSELKMHANEVRKNIIRMVYAAQSGHPGGSLSATDIVTYLYFNEMKIDKENLDMTERDRFVLSKGHASPLLYAILKEKGFLDEDLTSFRQIDSPLQGHPNMNYVKGVDMSTGSLGQGISCAVGMAIANKVNHNHHRVYTLLGDGECEEGQVWEAVMAAAHYKLNNLCAIIDYNGLQIDGKIEEVINPAPFANKFEAFGWHVITLQGHDFEAIQQAFTKARACEDKPTLLLAKTIKGKGVSYMENNYTWHGSAPNVKQFEDAMKELGGK